VTHDSTKEIARRIRGLKKDVERLKGQRENEGEVNLLFSVSDTVEIDDSASLSITEGATFVTDESTTDGSDLTG